MFSTTKNPFVVGKQKNDDNDDDQHDDTNEGSSADISDNKKDEPPNPPPHRHHDRRSLYAKQSKKDRASHLDVLIKKQRARDKFIEKLRRVKPTPPPPSSDDVGVGYGGGDDDGGGGGPTSLQPPAPALSTLSEEEEATTTASTGVGSVSTDILSLEEKDEIQKDFKEIQSFIDVYGKIIMWSYPVTIKLSNVSFSVQFAPGSNKIKTVYNSSLIYDVVSFFKKRYSKQEQQGTTTTTTDADAVRTKYVLNNISLCLKPGKMYLVLGPPASGKSSLLKAIASRLKVTEKKGDRLAGSITYNGTAIEDEKNLHIENAIAFVDQLDRHAPRYTVKETFEFAFQCVRHNGKHCDFRFLPPELDTHDNRALARQLDKDHTAVQLVLNALQIDHVADTFVGNEEVRGVSGGQRRRVTVGEMMMNTTPIFCGDEISNGLDASSTFDIVNSLMHLGRVRNRVSVISLLQPSPETVSLFDEVIVMAEGKLLYAGPIHDVEDYFASLGYEAPIAMDIADFLQVISSPDGATMFRPTPELSYRRGGTTHPFTIDELAEEFINSRIGKNIQADIATDPASVSSNKPPPPTGADTSDSTLDGRRFEAKYANNFFRSFWLNLKRELTLWRRNKRVLIANTIKNIIMGVSVGGVFFQTDDSVSILGVLFQGMLFVMLSAMAVSPGFVDERIVVYKQADANFFSAYPFVLAKATSKLPQTLMDCINFGVILYFMVGLAPGVGYFFTFMGIFFVFNILMNEYLFLFATFASAKASVQVAAACIVFFSMLFAGFIIAPNTIPSYYVWIYWYSPMTWAYRALVVNEFTSTKYTEADGQQTLQNLGFVDDRGQTFDREWIGWGFIYMLGHTLLTVAASALILNLVRVEGQSPPVIENGQDAIQDSNAAAVEDVDVPFKPITLSFENVCYDVKASTSDEDLRLLNNVNGFFKAGRMCALMGESGAGKTTLMDVIALRKNTGTVSGEILVNGFPQEKLAFRRCSGYVEQFDVQTPQLTVRETVLFSARLRLDSAKVPTDEEKQRFCDKVMKTLELTPLADSLVGSDEEGGLSFEQRKRLSIAVELAASPSILFLDEPTTGLDARSASLVVTLLRSIANEGRTIIATIHQPSSAVFEMFDDLLLLKKGGYSVYFGELGQRSKALIEYFERHGASAFEAGDNPANWMLRVLHEVKDNPAEIYLKTPEFAKLQKQLAKVKVDPPKELEISYSSEFAVPIGVRERMMNRRLRTVYWRSPAYNQSRLLMSIVLAFILGSVFITQRKKEILTESDVQAYFSVTFLSFIIIGILCITSVLPVMLKIRDVFYKQRAAGMIDDISLGRALAYAEKSFMVLSSFLFCLFYLATAGTIVPIRFVRYLAFWGFFTFNLAIYSYFGQAFMCLVPHMATAQILCSVFIGLNNFFSGLIVRPQFMTGIFAFTYWITPGHYVYEGMIVAQYWNDKRTVIANPGSEFYEWLGCGEDDDSECTGDVEQYLWVFFGGKFNSGNIPMDVLVLALFLVLARVCTYFAIRYFNYTST